MRASLSTREVRSVQAFRNHKLNTATLDVQFEPGPGTIGDSITVFVHETDREHAASVLRELAAAALTIVAWLEEDPSLGAAEVQS